eukprot:14819101-Alexandrium_andersonii.AAC.1
MPMSTRPSRSSSGGCGSSTSRSWPWVGIPAPTSSRRCERCLGAAWGRRRLQEPCRADWQLLRLLGRAVQRVADTRGR